VGAFVYEVKKPNVCVIYQMDIMPGHISRPTQPILSHKKDQGIAIILKPWY
jgi:hypothetical protein